MRIYNTAPKYILLHLIEGDTSVPPRVWYPSEGEEELSDDNKDSSQVHQMSMDGRLLVKLSSVSSDTQDTSAEE